MAVACADQAASNTSTGAQRAVSARSISRYCPDLYSNVLSSSYSRNRAPSLMSKRVAAEHHQEVSQLAVEQGPRQPLPWACSGHAVPLLTDRLLKHPI